MIRYGEYLHVRVLEKVGERGGNIDRILGEIGIYIFLPRKLPSLNSKKLCLDKTPREFICPYRPYLYRP